jgi:hypothetical protein
MIIRRYALLLLLITGALGLLPTAAVAHECPACPSFKNPATADAKNLASLVGCWVGRGPDGVAAKITYEIGSGGSALIEKLSVVDQEPVFTVYHMDGDTTLAEHFCSLGTQVRMRSEPATTATVLTLRLYQATNIALSPTGSHMTYVRFNFSDTTRLQVEWGLDCGDVETPQAFVFTRAAC